MGSEYLNVAIILNLENNLTLRADTKHEERSQLEYYTIKSDTTTSHTGLF